MQNLATLVQAISTAILALLTIWVIFFSEVGDLAIQLLQTELWETKQEINVLQKEKEEIKNQRNQLQDEQRDLKRQREEHLVHVVNGRLRDLWYFGVQTLAAYRNLAELSQELLNLAEKVEQFRNWDEGKTTTNISKIWYFSIPNPEEVEDYKRTEWGDILIDSEIYWKCSKDYRDFLKVVDNIEFDPQGSTPGTKRRAELVGEWQRQISIEYQRRQAEFHVTCFDELESKVRQQIELEGDKTALRIRDFSERLLQSHEVIKVDKEVSKRIGNRLRKELSLNRQLADLKIQLLVPKGVPLQEIAEEAKQIIINVKVARDWLDEATKDRHKWAK